MTTPKEALELKPCPFCGSSAETLVRGIWYPEGASEKESVVWCPTCDCKGPEKAWNTRATASLAGDAVERVARIINPEAFSISPSVYGLKTQDEMEKQTVVGAVRATARDKADAILATGLVAGEAAMRGDWHTTGWDRARNSGRILLVWSEFAGVREHIELGWYSDSKAAWVNTYGRPFHAEPDGWAPLLPFKTAETIRAAEREKCEHRVEELDCLYINDERCPFGGIPADPETSIRREAIKECLAAIRSGGTNER